MKGSNLLSQEKKKTCSKSDKSFYKLFLLKSEDMKITVQRWIKVQQEFPEKLFLYPTSFIQGMSGMIREPKPHHPGPILPLSGNMNNPHCG